MAVRTVAFAACIAALSLSASAAEPSPASAAAAKAPEPPASTSSDLPAPSRPVKIVCFGDSITYGYAASDIARTSYPARLQSLIDGKFGPGRYAVVNAGVSGEDTRRGLKRLDDLLKRERPAFVLIEYGTNDLWTSRKIPVAETEANVAEMLKRVQASPAKAFVATLPPVWQDDARVAERNDAIRRAAEARSASVIDLNKAFEDAIAAAGGRDKKKAWEDVYAWEGTFLHPNDKGNELLAAKWFGALMQSMGK